MSVRLKMEVRKKERNNQVRHSKDKIMLNVSHKIVRQQAEVGGLQDQVTTELIRGKTISLCDVLIQQVI